MGFYQRVMLVFIMNLQAFVEILISGLRPLGWKFDDG